VAPIDLKSGGEASGAGRETEKLTGLALALHQLDAIEGLKGPDENGRGDSRRLADDIEHEVRAIVEKNVGVAWTEIHRANARSRSAKMMSRGIARRIGFCLYDAAAQPARGKIVDNDFSDEEASELDGVRWKLGAAEAADYEFRR
jgi:hypothetical protein